MDQVMQRGIRPARAALFALAALALASRAGAAGVGVGRRTVGIAEIDPVSAVNGSQLVRSLTSQEAENGVIEIRDVTGGFPGVLLGKASADSEGQYAITVSPALSTGRLIQAFNVTRSYCSSGIKVEVEAAPVIDGPLKAGATKVKGKATPGHTLEIYNAVSGAMLGSPLSLAAPGDGEFEFLTSPLLLFHAVVVKDTSSGVFSKVVPVLGLSRRNVLPATACTSQSAPTVAAPFLSERFDCQLQHPRGAAVGSDGNLYVAAGSPPSDIIVSSATGVFKFNTTDQSLTLFAAVNGIGVQFAPSLPVFGADLYVARPRIFNVRNSEIVDRGDGEVFRVDSNLGETEVFRRILDQSPATIAFDTSNIFGDGLPSMLVSSFSGSTLKRIKDDRSIVTIPLTARPTLSPPSVMGIMGLAVSPGGAFGSFIYATQPSAGRIVRIDSAGQVEPFAQGLGSPTGIVFSPGGAFPNVLLVADAEAGEVVGFDDLGARVSFSGENALASGLRVPFGLATSAAPTKVYVTEYATGAIVRIHP